MIKLTQALLKQEAQVKKGKIKFKGIRKIKHVGVDEDCWFV
jgi:hypothetical protein